MTPPSNSDFLLYLGIYDFLFVFMVPFPFTSSLFIILTQVQFQPSFFKRVNEGRDNNYYLLFTDFVCPFYFRACKVPFVFTL